MVKYYKNLNIMFPQWYTNETTYLIEDVHQLFRHYDLVITNLKCTSRNLTFQTIFCSVQIFRHCFQTEISNIRLLLGRHLLRIKYIT